MFFNNTIIIITLFKVWIVKFGANYIIVLIFFDVCTMGFRLPDYHHLILDSLESFRIKLTGFQIPLTGFQFPLTGFKVSLTGFWFLDWFPGFHELTRFQIALTGFQVSLTGFLVTLTEFQVSLTGFMIPLSGFQIPLKDYRFSWLSSWILWLDSWFPWLDNWFIWMDYARSLWWSLRVPLLDYLSLNFLDKKFIEMRVQACTMRNLVALKKSGLQNSDYADWILNYIDILLIFNRSCTKHWKT